jgi:hypothetical protein
VGCEGLNYGREHGRKEGKKDGNTEFTEKMKSEEEKRERDVRS